MPFEKGNPGGPGRPPKAVEDAKQSILFELFNEKEERAVVTNMIRLAKNRAAPNAVPAAIWLWDRKYGKVKEQVEQSGGLTIKVVYTDESPVDD